MTPIDRVAQRAQAFTVLGVAASASRDDIRQAYRKLAFDKHPDRSPETSAEFAKITEAYQFVTAHAAELGIDDGTTRAPAANSTSSPRRVSRPSLQASQKKFGRVTIVECQKLLEEEGEPGGWHVATEVYRVGRNLTYYVPSRLEKGRNEIAFPTGMLTDSRRPMPRIIAIDSSEAPGGFYKMDQETCAEHFPGARSIQIRFGST